VQLTLYTDYGLRVLIYLACHDDDGTVGAIAERYGISRNHLVKVVHALSQKGFVTTIRGRSGGLRLARPAAEINVGEVVRALETNRALVECFSPEQNTCPIAPVCALKGALAEAEMAFQRVLDGYTLADVTKNPGAIVKHLLPSA
jgi:Rrf2 family transcriptional regulator, nitric oxide-sensitive transcriptional repressor